MANELDLRARIAGGSRNPEDYQALAKLLCASERYSEAVEVLKAALNLPLSEIQRGVLMVNLGWCQFEFFGRVGDALDSVRVGLQCVPQERDDVEASRVRAGGHSLLAHCTAPGPANLQAEIAHRSLQLFTELLSREPGSQVVGEAAYHSARLHCLLGNYDEAIHYSKVCIEVGQSKDDRLYCAVLLGSAFRETGDLDQAIRTLEGVRGQLQENSSLLAWTDYEFGRIALDRKHFAEARDHLQHAARSLGEGPLWSEDNSQAIRLMMDIELKFIEGCHGLEDYQEAVSACNRILSLRRVPEEYRQAAKAWLGWCNLGLGRYPAAQECFEAVTVRPRVSDEYMKLATDGLKQYHNTLVKSFWESGQLEKAHAEYEGLLALCTEDDTYRNGVLLGLGHCRFDIGWKAEAMLCYEKILSSVGATAEQQREAREGLEAIRSGSHP